jgi:hypothetical protein
MDVHGDAVIIGPQHTLYLRLHERVDEVDQ